MNLLKQSVIFYFIFFGIHTVIFQEAKIKIITMQCGCTPLLDFILKK